MSSALAIAGVTAVLRDLLNDGLINHDVSGMLGSIKVSALSPDRVVPVNGTENTQLNLFLHQVSPNLGWRNEGLPARDGSGRNRLSNPPLALDLHYLLSAYGAEDLHADILLGYAMQILHETPVLTRSAIRTALQPSPDVGTALPPALQALADCGLADQVEQIKITPEYLSSEEMSKLWTAVQSHFRLTAAYLVSVVLIDAAIPTRATLPVLSRGPVDPNTGRDRGVVVEPSLLPPYPTIETVSPTSKQSAATVGATVDISGHHLDGTDWSVLLSNTRLQIEAEVTDVIGESSTSVPFTAPDIPVGIYQLTLRVVRPGETEPRTSNQLAVIIGPEITTAWPMSVARDGAGTAVITLDCQPQVRPEQRVSLLLGTREVPAEPFNTATRTLSFVVEAASVGDYLARLRVDGIDSAIIERAATPPVFLNHWISIT